MSLSVTVTAESVGELHEKLHSLLPPPEQKAHEAPPVSADVAPAQPPPAPPAETTPPSSEPTPAPESLTPAPANESAQQWTP